MCTFKIHRDEIEKARALAQGIEGIKFKDYGAVKNTERIRKRSEPARDEGDGMEMPSIKFENSTDDYEE